MFGGRWHLYEGLNVFGGVQHLDEGCIYLVVDDIWMKVGCVWC